MYYFLDHKSLLDCNVKDGSRIFLVIKKTEFSAEPTYFDILYKLLCKHCRGEDAKLVLNEYKKVCT